LFYGAEQNTGLTEQDHVNMNLRKVVVSAREMKLMPWYNKIQVPTNHFLLYMEAWQSELKRAKFQEILYSRRSCHVKFHF